MVGVQLHGRDQAPRPENRGTTMKTSFTGKFAAFFLLILSGLLSFSASEARADQGDPPTRVGRISSLDGSVSIQPGGTGDWGSAARNRPVTVGDKLWSDRDSRVELRAGQASIHMGSDTALSFLNLDQNMTQMRLSEGSLNFRVRELREGDLYEVDTPNLAFTVRQAGAFRIDVNENGDSSTVTVIRGEGEVTSGGSTYPVRGGERAEFTGTDQIQYNADRAPAPDSLDRWASERDLKEDNAVSSRYVSRDMSGYDDLDDYGDWRDVPEYGHVWYPRDVEVGWAPYSTGSWSWVGPWGWTWVDDSPWGFAPYHYGRWSYIGGGWGWCPGPIYAEPIYGPAFVGFLGGGGWSVGLGFGGGFGYGVGWFPLGFGEPYCPWYGYSGNYLRNVNVSNTYISNTTIINNTTINNYNYQYAHDVNAVTATTQNNFVNGHPVNRGEAHLTEASLRGAQVTNKLAATPTRASYFGNANASKNVATPPAKVIDRPVVARTAPAPAASHVPVHTVNASTLAPGREAGRSGNLATNGSVNTRGAVSANPGVAGRAPVTQSQSAPVTARQRELSLNRPPSASLNGGRPAVNAPGYAGPHGTSNVAPPRMGAVQGNAPAERGRPNSVNNNTPVSRPISANRPPWAGTSRSDAGVNSTPRSANTPNYNNNRPSVTDRQTRPTMNGNRSYAPPTRSTPNYDNNSRGSSGGNRSYAPPQRTAPTYNNSRPPAASENRSYAPWQRSAPSNENRNYSAPRSSSPSPRSYSPPTRSESAPRAYSAPSRSYSAPSPSYSAPRSYSAPSAPSRSYSAPSRSYSEPRRSYSAPSPSYSAPRSYSAPSAPARSYSAPSRGYSTPSAPSRNYSAPSRSYSAPPSHSSGSSGGSSPHGGDVNHGRH